MEPLKPETRRAILQDRPQADPAEIEEYERLLAQRFAEDPDKPKPHHLLAVLQDREARLVELHKKLFGP